MSEKFYTGVKVKGPADQAKEVFEFLIGKSEDDGSQMNVDFKTVIPMPEELFDKHYYEPNDAFSYNNGKLPDDYDYNLLTKRANWSLENWGCNYNAYDATIDHTKNCIGLFLLGGDALPVIEGLSKIFPKLVFVYEIIGDSSDLRLYTFYDGQIVKYCDMGYVAWEMSNGDASQYNSILHREIFDSINPEIKNGEKQEKN